MISKTTLLKPLILSFFFCLTFSFSNAQLLLAHYKFDNSLADETGEWDLSDGTDFAPTFETGFDGTPNGAVSGFGQSDYLVTASNFVISGNDPRSMTAWVKAESYDEFNAILGLGQSSPGARWTFTLTGTTNPTFIQNNGSTRLEIQGDGFNSSAPEQEPNSENTIELGAWGHVAATYDSSTGTAKLFVNGELVKSHTFSSVNTLSTPLRVGNDFQANIPSRGFTGALDDVRVYAGALSDAEVKEIYDNSLLSVNEVSTVESFSAYPNPVENRLYFSSNEVSDVEVYNLLGAKVLTQKVNNGVDTSSLDKGVYLVNCFNSQGLKLKTIKILK